VARLGLLLLLLLLQCSPQQQLLPLLCLVVQTIV
jgi:hypothetical protein